MQELWINRAANKHFFKIFLFINKWIFNADGLKFL